MRVKHPRYANYHKIDKFMYVSGFSDGESRVRPVFSKQKTTKRSKKTETVISNTQFVISSSLFLCNTKAIRLLTDYE